MEGAGGCDISITSEDSRAAFKVEEEDGSGSDI